MPIYISIYIYIGVGLSREATWNPMAQPPSTRGNNNNNSRARTIHHGYHGWSVHCHSQVGKEGISQPSSGVFSLEAYWYFHQWDGIPYIWITGETPQTVYTIQSSAEKFIESHKILYKISINETIITSSKEVIHFVDEWLAKYPVCTLWQNNCQKFAKDFSMHFFAYDLVTQMDELVVLGWRIIYFGVAIVLAGTSVIYMPSTNIMHIMPRLGL
jgi:hypothetical protein